MKPESSWLQQEIGHILFIIIFGGKKLPNSPSAFGYRANAAQVSANFFPKKFAVVLFYHKPMWAWSS
jgi:hypothetical protein